MDRPGVSCNNQSYIHTDHSNVSLIRTQPFVKCFINNVEVHALIDTGSMRTFINNKIHNIIDFDSTLIDTTVEERCVSITGGSLNILGHVNANVKFPKSKTAHKGRFLVSDNISYDCVLGWDFLKQHKLSLKGNFANGCSSYYLAGSHGRTEVKLYSLPKGESVSGVTEASGVHAGETSEACEGDNSTVLIQSRMKADIAVVLDQNVIVPARTEMILEGRLVQSPKAEVGMIAPYSNSHDLDNGMHVAHTVVCPKGRNVFLRVMNAQSKIWDQSGHV